MNFSSFLKTPAKTNKINESLTREQESEFKSRFEALAKKVKKLDSRLYEIYEEHYDFKLGLSVRELPTLNIGLSFDGKEVKVSQSSSDFTQDVLLEYSDLLKEVGKNYELIKELLVERKKLERDINDAFK